MLFWKKFCYFGQGFDCFESCIHSFPPIIFKMFTFHSLVIQAPRNSLNNHLFEKANQDAYSDPGTRLVVQNNDFDTASQSFVCDRGFLLPYTVIIKSVVQYC